jgi:hypothetical protein
MTKFIQVNDVRQVVNYYLLPKNNSEYLYINLPYLILEEVDNWINKGNLCDIYLCDFKKFTFKNAYVLKHDFSKNRYGDDSTNLYISFKFMLNGIYM